jgi:hypothetical protein
MAATATRTVHTGTGTWQNTPSQLTSEEITALTYAYSARLHNLYAAQVRLYTALLWTDVKAAESAARDLRQAVSALPPMPGWPDTDEELIARLKGKFAPLPPDNPEIDKHLTTAWDREHRAEAAQAPRPGRPAEAGRSLNCAGAAPPACTSSGAATLQRQAPRHPRVPKGGMNRKQDHGRRACGVTDPPTSAVPA